VVQSAALKLTRRQREFLAVLIGLWKKHGAAVHYTRLAEQVGVGRFSAYDMLRVLESKGLVEAHYAVERDNHAAGRSSVFYAPTEAGLSEMHIPLGAPLLKEWHTFRDRLLGRLRTGQIAGYRALMDDLMEQIPQRHSSLLYCGEVITALLINLNGARERITEVNPVEVLKSLTSESDEASLDVLAGLSLGAGLNSEADLGQVSRLFDYTRRYQKLFRELGTDGKRILSTFLQDAIKAIG